MIQKRYDEAEAVASGRKLYPYKKIPFSQLAEINLRNIAPTIFAIELEGETFEFLINHRSESKTAVIFGTGGIKLGTPNPNFHRHMWKNELPCTGIWYADPTIYDTELSLGWGYGRNDRWYLQDIAFLLRIILTKLNINERDTLFFGSSGGGTTASYLAAIFGSKATVINPQLNVLCYWPSHVNRLRELVRERERERERERSLYLSTIDSTFFYFFKKNIFTIPNILPTGSTSLSMNKAKKISRISSFRSC